MNDETVWTKTYTALNEFSKLLTCKKCKKPLNNAKQFLNCGHFACGQCADGQTDCIICGIPGEKSEVLNDSTLNDLILNLNVISKAVQFSSSHGSNTDDDSVTVTKTVDGTNINFRKQNVTKLLKTNDDVSSISICESTTSKSTSRGNISLPKNINKKNTKGETALHCACRKNQIDRVKTLVEAGADPNTKDNAGWTPLQEATCSGYYEVCELLLNSGAKPDMYGLDNRTALHEAVKNDDVSLALLLLNFNANPKVYDNVGKKPKDYSKSKEMTELFTISRNSVENSSVGKASHSEKSFIVSNIESRIVLFGSNLRQKNRKLLAHFGNEKKIKVAANFSPLVTHVIVETDKNKQIKLSFEVLLALLHGKSFISSDCLQILMENERIVARNLDIFEVNPPQLENGPVRSKENKINQHPQLFDNCYFYFKMKNHENVNYDDMTITKDQLIKLVEAGDGIVLTREPKPDDIQGSISPFHVANDINHSLHKCTHYIIYIPDNCNLNFKRVMYNMAKLKTLPLMWLIESILRFKLLDPVDLGL